ncbi:hypothetical protein Scinn_15890 [Streptomyces virginiae]|uniref:Uncharacterized protein n=1 Tax=Streptomyces virginiae TaxID=1961 RepID=A0ABQ3NH89_STRVG|nr:hypothetical protein Scinn_15890 [Streptomyces virginiae]
MTRNRRRLGAWLLAGVVLAVVLTLYDADRTGVSDPKAAPSATPSGAAPGTPAPTTGDTPSPSATASPSPAPGTGEPSPAPSPTTCTSPGACGYPDANSTGPRIALERHDTGNMSVKKDGTVIKGWDIRGSLDIYANDVTVIDSRITSTNWWGINLRPGFSGLKVLHTPSPPYRARAPTTEASTTPCRTWAAAPSKSAGATSRSSATPCPWARATCTTTTCTTSSPSATRAANGSTPTPSSAAAATRAG